MAVDAAACDLVPDTVMELPNLLDMAAAESLRERLLERVLGVGAVVVGGEAVDRVATPCLQVLLAAALSARSRGVTFELRSPSSALVHAMTDAGIASVLGH